MDNDGLITKNIQKEINEVGVKFENLQQEIDVEISKYLIDDSYTYLQLEKNVQKIIDKRVMYAKVGAKEIGDKVASEFKKLESVSGKKIADVYTLQNKRVDGLTKKIATSGLKSAKLYEKEIKRVKKEADDEEIAKKNVDKVLKAFVRDDRTSSPVYNRRSYRAQYVSDYELKKSIVEQHDELLFDEMKTFEYNLVIVSAHSDCSPLCVDYQGGIYTRDENDDSGYEFYDTILFENGGGFRHPNCRHDVKLFVEGLTDVEAIKENIVPDEQREKEYKKRQFEKEQQRKRVIATDRMKKSKALGLKEEEAKYKQYLKR